MDRGFNVMIPKQKEEEKEQPDNLYDYNIKFTLFNRVFSFAIKVDNNRRTK
tara:strand:+ start:1234 stop:1386 length:153 start_codon:yes stop_codon:yes gene_type:complete